MRPGIAGKNKNWAPHWVWAVPPLGFLGIFFFYPLARILTISLGSVGEDGGWPLVRQLTTGAYLRIGWFTFWQAALSSGLTLFLGLPGAWVFARYAFPAKRLMWALIAIPFVLPTVVVASAFRALLGPAGVVNESLMRLFGLSAPLIRLEGTLWFFLLAHVFYNYSLVVRIVGGFWANLDERMVEAAQTLGASKWESFWKITFPLLLPAVGSASLLTFVFCFTSFGVMLILGGPGYATVEVEIYRQAVQLFNLPAAAVLSLLQLVFCGFLMWLQAIVGQRSASAFIPQAGVKGEKIPRTTLEKGLVWGVLFFMAILLAAPPAALVIRSLVNESGFSFIYYQSLFHASDASIFYVPPVSAVMNSLGFAAMAIALAVPVGAMAARYVTASAETGHGIFEGLVMTPLAVSAVTLGFGFIVSFNRAPLNLRDSILLVPMAHGLVAFPFVVRTLVPSLRRIPARLKEAAAVLGAAPFTVWRRIELPLSGRAVTAGAVFAFCVSLGEFGATAFVARPQRPTLPVAIYRFLGMPGELNFGQALAMSVILMTATAAGFILLEKLGEKSLGEF